jgi:hypothetical protein
MLSSLYNFFSPSALNQSNQATLKTQAAKLQAVNAAVEHMNENLPPHDACLTRKRQREEGPTEELSLPPHKKAASTNSVVRSVRSVDLPPNAGTSSATKKRKFNDLSEDVDVDDGHVKAAKGAEVAEEVEEEEVE